MLYSQSIKTIVTLSLVSLFTSGCNTLPHYQSSDTQQLEDPASSVIYQIDPVAAERGLSCLSIAPLQIHLDARQPIHFKSISSLGADKKIDYADIHHSEIYDYEMDANDKQLMLRNMLYGFIAPHRSRDIELAEIDRYVSSGNPRQDYKKLVARVNCPWVLLGEITEFSVDYYGVYSRILVGADLKIIHQPSGKVVWQGKHRADSHNGAVPVSPVDIAIGAAKAAMNINPEQVEKTVSDLARRLVRTMPLESDNSFLFAAKRAKLYKVIASRLNMRKGPGKDYRVTQVLKKQQQVKVIKSKHDGQWLLVRTLKGDTGYVASRFVN